jgi:RimJ/RimL family protein N-acetyltransferase
MTTPRAFYSGETIDLVVPTIEHVESSSWADWFNSQQTNRYTNHAIFPNTVEYQRDFFLSLRDSGRLALMVTSKGNDEPIGTVSLSGIDFRKRLATIAIVMDTESEVPKSTFASLEAMAALTQHTFDVLGLERVQAGQVYPALAKWNQLLEILGYRSEGFRRAAFSRGHDVSDEVTLACLYPHYRRIVESRGGSLWPGSTEALALIRALPRKPFAELLDESYRSIEAEYFGDSA